MRVFGELCVCACALHSQNFRGFGLEDGGADLAVTMGSAVGGGYGWLRVLVGFIIAVYEHFMPKISQTISSLTEKKSFLFFFQHLCSAVLC